MYIEYAYLSENVFQILTKNTLKAFHQSKIDQTFAEFLSICLNISLKHNPPVKQRRKPICMPTYINDHNINMNEKPCTFRAAKIAQCHIDPPLLTIRKFALIELRSKPV